MADATEREGREQEYEAHHVEPREEQGKTYAVCTRCGKTGPPPYLDPDEWDEPCDPSESRLASKEKIQRLAEKIERMESGAAPQDADAERDARLAETEQEQETGELTPAERLDAYFDGHIRLSPHQGRQAVRELRTQRYRLVEAVEEIVSTGGGEIVCMCDRKDEIARDALEAVEGDGVEILGNDDYRPGLGRQDAAAPQDADAEGERPMTDSELAYCLDHAVDCFEPGTVARRHIAEAARRLRRGGGEGRFDEAMLNVLEEAARKIPVTGSASARNAPVILGLDRIKQAIRHRLRDAPSEEGGGESECRVRVWQGANLHWFAEMEYRNVVYRTQRGNPVVALEDVVRRHKELAYPSEERPGGSGEVPSRETLQRWVEEYAAFGEFPPDGEAARYYPDLGSYLHDQLARRQTARRLRRSTPEASEGLSWMPVADSNDLKACPKCGELALEGEGECSTCGTEPTDDRTWRRMNTVTDHPTPDEEADGE